MGPQQALIDCPVYEVLYGGARGGGKTDGLVGKYLIKAHRHPEFNGVIFRREMPQADDLWERAAYLFGRANASKINYGNHTIELRNGARLRLRPLADVSAAEKYQGQNLTDVGIEEAGNFPDPRPIQRLHGALRSAYGVPTQMILTANPGGPGQQWVKQRYIDPAPQGMRVIDERLPNGSIKQRIFIPARVRDNLILLKNDPDYVSNLYLVGSRQLVQAWLDGDWNAIEGAFFDCWSSEHVLTPFQVPADWVRFRSMDWGSAKPFSVGWWVLVPDWFRTPCGAWLPRGAMVRYREWYGCIEGKPNTGLKLTAEQVGDGIVAREAGDSIKYGVLDPAAFAEDGGPSLAERLFMRGVRFRPADNKRVSTRGALGGWDMMRQRFVGEDFGEPHGQRPMIYTFSTCAHSIRTIPALQHDETHPEDVDTDGEDHAGDEWRYACMSRPWIPKPREEQKPRIIQIGGKSTETFNDLMAAVRRERERENV